MQPQAPTDMQQLPSPQPTHLDIPPRWQRRHQPPKTRLPPPLRPLPRRQHLPRNQTRARHDPAQKQHHERGELATDQKHQREQRDAPHVPATADQELEIAPRQQAVVHGALQVARAFAVDDVPLQRAGGFVVGPDVFDARLVEGQVGAAEPPEVREQAAVGAADGEDERGRERGGWAVDACVVRYACGGRGGVVAGGGVEVEVERGEESKSGCVEGGEFVGLGVIGAGEW